MGDQILKSGTITKMGQAVKSWKRRFFVLRQDGLMCYYPASVNELTVARNKPKGYFRISTATTILDENACSVLWPSAYGQKCGFGIQNPDRTYFMYCDSAADADSWIETLSVELRRRGSVSFPKGRALTLSVMPDSDDEDDDIIEEGGALGNRRHTTQFPVTDDIQKMIQSLQADKARLEHRVAELEAKISRQPYTYSVGVNTEPVVFRDVAGMGDESEDDDDGDDEAPGPAADGQEVSVNKSEVWDAEAEAQGMLRVAAATKIQFWWRARYMKKMADDMRERSLNRIQIRIDGDAPVRAASTAIRGNRAPTTSLAPTGSVSHRLSVGQSSTSRRATDTLAILGVQRHSSVSMFGSKMKRQTSVRAIGAIAETPEGQEDSKPSTDENDAVDVVLDEAVEDLLFSEDQFDPDMLHKLRVATYLFNTKPQKGLRRFISEGFVKRDPGAIATFLYDQRGLSRRMVGEYLGDPDEYSKRVLQAFADAFDFADASVDQSLKLFMVGFRIPGEAQKIERIMESFAKRYHICNPGVFSHSDTAFILAFSILMLHTDLHNPSNVKKMTKPEFLRNNRGIDDGKDLPKDFLEAIYDNISKEEFQVCVDHTFPVEQLEARVIGKFDSALTTESRYFVNKLVVNELSRGKTAKAKRQITLFLFNDMIVSLSPKWDGWKYTLRKTISLFRADVRVCTAQRKSYDIYDVTNPSTVHLRFQIPKEANEDTSATFCNDLKECVSICRDIEPVVQISKKLKDETRA